MRLALFILFALMCGSIARADVLQLKDGRVLRGELIDETTVRIEFRTRVDGAWTTLSIQRTDIDRFFAEAGNQADEQPPPVKSPPPLVAQPEVEPDQASDSSGPVVVVPLHGQVGGLRDRSVEGTFDAEIVRRCLERAMTENAAVVVLELHSPGGFVAEMEIICQTILEYRDRLRIVSWPRDAMSAAAIVALVCPEMIVHPQARIGAAVMARDAGDGDLSALEAKYASPHHARQRQFMAAVNRPYEVVAAMTIQEMELWWSAETGFAATTPEAGGSEIEHIDGATTVLTMTGDDAVRWGLARAHAESRDALLEVLDLADTRVLDLASEVVRYNRSLDRKITMLFENFETYFQSLGRMHEAVDKLKAAESSGDEVKQARVKRELQSLFTDAREAARKLRQVDRAIITRRAALPEALVEQLVEDARVLAAVRAVVNDDRASLDEAKRGVATLLDRWRALLDG